MDGFDVSMDVSLFVYCLSCLQKKEDSFSFCIDTLLLMYLDILYM